MRAALTVARELLRCRMMESGRDTLLERVAELLDAAASGAPPFCYRLPPQATAGPPVNLTTSVRHQLRPGASSTSARPVA